MIDSHCHLADDAFVGDLDAAITRAREAGLTSALCILAAGDESEAARAEGVRQKWPDVRFATGVHPHAAGNFAENPGASAETTRAHATRFGACGIGEIGLDYHYDFAPRDVQQAVFREQIRLAHELRLPFAIHTREAEDDTFRIMNEERAGEVGGVFHCFTGDRDMARRALDIGFYVSLAGIVTFPRALELKEVARLVPMDRLLIETDSPFLAPVPHRGGRNEPAHVTRVAEVIAELRGTTAEAVGAAALDNFRRLFNP